MKYFDKWYKIQEHISNPHGTTTAFCLHLSLLKFIKYIENDEKITPEMLT